MLFIVGQLPTNILSTNKIFLYIIISRYFNILELINRECSLDKIKVPFLNINISLLIILITFFL